MVFVVAALYTLWKYRNQSNEEEPAGRPEANTSYSTTTPLPEGTTEPGVTTVPANTSTVTLSEQFQHFSDSARRGGSQLYHSALVRCASLPPQPTGGKGSPVQMSMSNPPPHTSTASVSSISTVASTNQPPAARGHNPCSPSSCLPMEEATVMFPTQTLTPQASAFLRQVREEWINAVFGPEYLSSDKSSANDGANTSLATEAQQGTGLAGIPYFVSYGATIAATSRGDKVGITISRLPIGLSVRHVEPGSEAFLAGVQEQSVLVQINGMVLLAEPTRQALERLWQYEGHFEEPAPWPPQKSTSASDLTNLSSSALSPQVDRVTSSSPPVLSIITSNNTTLSASLPQHSGSTAPLNNYDAVADPHRAVREPVALKFIRRGQVYSVLLLSNPPWGISWASCGNFALAKRVYAFAAAAGVKRGSLVSAINDQTFRRMDHADIASALRTAFESKQADIRLTLCFTPAASRSGYYEKSSPHMISPDGKNSVPNTKPVVATKSHDGVEVKFHPLEYALGSLCNSNLLQKRPTELGNLEGTVHELAEQVAAGLVEAPARLSPRQRQLLVSRPTTKIYGPCLSLNEEQLLRAWNPLEALVYCMRFRRLSYDRDAMADTVVIERNGTWSPLEVLRTLTSDKNAATLSSSFLLQFLSLICMRDHNPGASAGDENYHGHATEQKLESSNEEKKVDDNFAMEAREPITASASSSSGRIANELTAMLLKLSRRDDGFCQRLYFLLRSYISTFETRRPASGKNDDESHNLMALLHCLELLRFAEKELSGRTAGLSRREGSPAWNSTRSMGIPPRAQSSKTIPTTQDFSLKAFTDDESIEQTHIAFSCLTGASKPETAQVTESPPPTPPRPPLSSLEKKRGIIGLFRKKKVKKQEEVGPLLRSRSSPTVPTQSKRSPQRVEQTKKEPARSEEALAQSPSAAYENMSDFLTELDRICSTIERSLQKSFRQKIAEWAMQPWTASKDSALAEVTATMRDSLKHVNDEYMLLVNPVDSSELLSSVDHNDCYILPSAHFPILLTFDVSERRCSDSTDGVERLYRTEVELVALHGTIPEIFQSFIVHGAVAGSIVGSGESTSKDPEWPEGYLLDFETRSSWGAPQTVSLRLSGKIAGRNKETFEVGYSWIDLSKLWQNVDKTDQSCSARFRVELWQLDNLNDLLDDHGFLPNSTSSAPGRLELELRVKTQCVDFDDHAGGTKSRKRMLLYKHDDDLRQEDFAVQFIRTCDEILKASGLDLHILSFQCIPVGVKRGFVEWVPGSVPMSEICQPFAGSILADKRTEDGAPSMFAKAGLTKYESLRRLSEGTNDPVARLTAKKAERGTFANNPVQDYLRSIAYDREAPFLVRRDVMDVYIKSCAGYSVITYILGVGDRHLDNLLLHQSGRLFHCDYSFILGSDPKTYLPMRITDDMIHGMGGRESDNYAKFLSFAGAAFLTLRRPENVRVILSMVRLMESSCLPDISENQTVERAVMGVRQRLRLDLTENQALSYMDELIEASLSNKMWMAVDAIHSLGKRF